MSGLIPASQAPIEVAVALVSVAVASIFYSIAARLYRRPVSDTSRLASYQFSLWWVGIGTVVALNALLILLGLANALPFALAITLYLVSLIVDCVFLWAIVGALTYVYTGKYHLLELGAFYFLFYALLLYWAISQDPRAVALAAGVPSLTFGTAAVPALSLFVALGLLVPGIVAALLYLSLLRETRDPAIRFRITLVGGSILLWFGIEIFVSPGTAGVLLVRTVLEVVPGLLSLIALIPPAWVRRRIGVSVPVGQEEYYRRKRAPP